MLDICQLGDFLDSSPTPYHASQEMLDTLVDAGFVLLDEKQSWNLLPGGKYAVCRDNASVIAGFKGGRFYPDAEQQYKFHDLPIYSQPHFECDKINERYLQRQSVL